MHSPSVKKLAPIFVFENPNAGEEDLPMSRLAVGALAAPFVCSFLGRNLISAQIRGWKVDTLDRFMLGGIIYLGSKTVMKSTFRLAKQNASGINFQSFAE